MCLDSRSLLEIISVDFTFWKKMQKDSEQAIYVLAGLYPEFEWTFIFCKYPIFGVRWQSEPEARKWVSGNNELPLQLGFRGSHYLRHVSPVVQNLRNYGSNLVPFRFQGQVWGRFPSTKNFLGPYLTQWFWYINMSF